MPKPNYQFEKRQRELKKAKEQEEKRQKKLARDAEAATEPGISSDQAPASPTPPAE